MRTSIKCVATFADIFYRRIITRLVLLFEQVRVCTVQCVPYNLSVPEAKLSGMDVPP